MKKTALLTLVLALSFSARLAAQGGEWSQAQACPGWNNPANFTSGDQFNFYSGQNGEKDNQAPNVMNSQTGMTFSGSVLSAGQLANASVSTSWCGASNLPQYTKQFYISGDTTGTDPNTGNRLKYVPTHFNTHDTFPGVVNTRLTRSIRVGDGCEDAYAAALYYTMKVTPQNAMLYLYYAVVVEAPGHGTSIDPTFIIRIMKKVGSNWVQINDTMAYYVSSTPSDQGGTVVLQPDYNSVGWHMQGSGYSAIDYKDWAKVSINLANYMYEQVRVEVLMGDCDASGHWAYAYIAGECREMEIKQSGCPAGLSTDVTTLTAPRGMLGYKWYASEWGVSNPTLELYSGGQNEHFTFRALTAEGTEESGAFRYNVQADDFRYTRRRNAMGQTEPCNEIGNWQTFMCELKSAIDPAKPFKSRLYVNVQNTKATMAVDSLLMCDGSVQMNNLSQVPGDPTRVLADQTTWKFYNNATGSGTPAAEYTGASATHFYSNAMPKSVLVRTNTIDPTCYSEALYELSPRVNPHVGMTISERVLCDEATTNITDTSSEGQWREWTLREVTAAENDMTSTRVIKGTGDENRVLTMPFSHAVEPVELRVYNGLYWVDAAGDTNWCNSVARDTVSVFLHPELSRTGDLIVCEGSLTDVTVRAVGVDNCSYEWSTTPYTITGNLPAGQRLQVKLNNPKETYYIKVTSPQGCVAWDSVDVYLVSPELTMEPADGRICPGDVAVLTGLSADHYTWTATPADRSLRGQETADVIRVSPEVTTVYTMTGHGANDCDATPLKKTVTVVPLPEPRVEVTPGYVDTDNPKVTLRDASRNGVHSEWEFDDGGVATGREVTHTFEGAIGKDSARVVLTTLNELGCPVEYPFAVPVTLFTAWFPNVFTPGSQDGNSRFRLFTVNDYEYFHIYIYNRRGELVYESDDPRFQWDGTHDGEDLPQGTYVYTCRFRKPGTTTLSQFKGAITLLR